MKIWNDVSKEMVCKSKLTLLKELLPHRITNSNDAYLVIKSDPYDILLYGEKDCEPDYDGFALKTVLSDSNFKLIIKQEIAKGIISVFETSFGNPRFYQQVMSDVLNAF